MEGVMKRFRGLFAGLLLAFVLVTPASAVAIDQDAARSWWSDVVDFVFAWFGGSDDGGAFDPNGGLQGTYEADGGGSSTPQSSGCFDPFGRPKPCV